MGNNKMKFKEIKIILLFTLLIMMFSCNKEHSCYSKELQDEFKNKVCTMDCPGVKGCDGKTYCNECIANGAGIKVVK
jgi:hypothetical protein